jgi:WD40 repeat protein/beta-lactamase regulating signal transducer with metallopeptidase domain
MLETFAQFYSMWELALITRITVVLAVAWTIYVLLRRANPRWQVGTWRITCVGLIVVPFLSVMLPGWGPRFVPQTNDPNAGVDRSFDEASVETTAELPSFDPFRSLPPLHIEPVSTPINSIDPAFDEATQLPPASNMSIENILLFAYFSVATILLLRILVPMAALQRICQRSSRVDHDIQMLEQSVAHDLGLQRVPRVLTSAQTSVPFVVGVLRPRIVLPMSMMAGLSRQEARFVLAHETAHIAGCDVGWSVVAKLLQILLWPHPLVWRIAAAHRHACETLCDGIAAGTGAEPRFYLQTLARLALQLQEAALPDGAIAMIGRSEIPRRLDRIAQGIRSERLRSVPQLTALLAAATAIWAVATVGGNIARGGLESAESHSIASELPANAEVSQPRGETDGSKSSSAPVWNESKAKATWVGHNDFIHAITFSSDGKLLASGSHDRTAKLWELPTAMMRFSLAHEDEVSAVGFFPDGTKLATGTRRSVRIWDVTSAANVTTLEGTPHWMHSLDISNDNQMLIAGYRGRGGDFVEVWNLSNNKRTAKFSGNQLLDGTATFGPNGDAIVAGPFDGTIRIWDPVTGEPVATMHDGTTDRLMHLSPDGLTVISANLDNGTIHVWSYVTGKIKATIPGRGRLYDATLSPDGRMYATSSGREIHLWDLATGKNVATLRGHSPPIMTLAFSPNGQSLASASVGTLQLWDVKTAIAEPQQLLDISSENILDSRISLNSTDRKLSDIFGDLTTLYGLRIEIDPDLLKRVENDPSADFQCEFNGVTLRSALSILLQPAGLDWEPIDKGIRVATTEQLKTSQVAVRYVFDPEVKNLFGDVDPKTAREEFRKTIVSTIEPWTWVETGGRNTARWDDDGLIVVANRRKVQPNFECLAHYLTRSDMASFTLLENNESASIEARLRELTVCDFTRVPLNEVLNYFGDLHNLNIAINARSLSDAGVRSDTEITCQVNGESLSATLDKILDPLNLDHVVRNGVVVITSRQEAANDFATHIYVLKQLLKPGVQASRVIDHITATVAPESWSGKGGRGTIATSFYTVQPEGQAVVKRFGRVIAIKPPGLHFKLPLGIDRQTFVPTARVLKHEFGFRTTGDAAGIRTDYRKSPAHQEESLMLTGD